MDDGDMGCRPRREEKRDAEVEKKIKTNTSLGVPLFIHVYKLTQEQPGISPDKTCNLYTINTNQQHKPHDAVLDRITHLPEQGKQKTK